MLKLNTGYSKKVPVPGQDFSSHSYHASLETELSDALEPEDIRDRIQDTFETVRRAVERELDGESPPAERTAPRADSKTGGKNGNGGPASNRQIKYLNDLAGGQGIGVRQLNARLREKYGAETVYELTRKQASEIIDALQAQGRSKAA